MSDIQNDKDLKPSDHILDDFLHEVGAATTWDTARRFLADLREAFKREDDATPAVPQPADARLREHLDSCVWIDPGRQSGQPCFGGTRVPVAPFMAIVDEAGEDAAKAFWPSITDAHIAAGRAWQAAVPQPVDRTRHAIWRAVYEAATEQGLQPSGVADKATDAVLALSAQPVDREALMGHLISEKVILAESGWWDTPSALEAERIADAVLALLAGEQEQLEK